MVVRRILKKYREDLAAAVVRGDTAGTLSYDDAIRIGNAAIQATAIMTSTGADAAARAARDLRVSLCSAVAAQLAGCGSGADTHYERKAVASAAIALVDEVARQLDVASKEALAQHEAKGGGQ